MKIWINGAEGFIGSYLANELDVPKNEILRTSKSGSSTLFGDNCSACDITDSDDVDNLIKDFRPDRIFHLAAQSLPNISFDDPMTTFDVNINGSWNIFEAVRKYNNSSELVIASTSAQYGDVDPSLIPVTEDHPFWPLQPYGISKAAMEMLAHQMHKSYGLKYKAARIFNTTGPKKKNDICNDFWKRIHKSIGEDFNSDELKISTGRIDTKRAYLDVRDTVSGLMSIADSGSVGEAYNICGDQLHSGEDILEYFSEVLGLQVGSEQNHMLMRPTDEKIIYGSTVKLKELGWSQKYNLKETIKAIVDE